MRRLTFAGKQQDRSNHYCTPAKDGQFSTEIRPLPGLLAYHKPDDSLSRLGCVADWQQETRGLISLVARSAFA